MKNESKTNQLTALVMEHKRRFKSFALFMAFCLSVGFAPIFAQTVSGTVTGDDGEPLIGVNVMVKGTTYGTITDFDGSYSLNAKPEDVLVFSYVGFMETEMPVGNQEDISLKMGADAQTLDEIVVIGYGTSKKSHLTGAISKVDADKLDKLPVQRVDDALVGQVSGVNIAATEGEAGSAPTIRIRGVGSVSAGASPLIVVDGLVVDNDFLGALDMNDVSSFEILKDAASCAIYGSRGGNGVILITTKNGSEGKTKFSYNGSIGNKEAHRSDAYSFSIAESAAAELNFLRNLTDAEGVPLNLTEEEIFDRTARTRYKQQIGVDRDWQDVIFDGGTIQSHSISARGGDSNTNFSATFGYSHDEGVLLTDDNKRYNMNFKMNTKINDRISFGAAIAPSYQQRRRFDGSTHDILRQTSWLPVYHDENTIQYVDRDVYPDVQVGDYAVQRHFDNYTNVELGLDEQDISNTSNTNPAAKVIERERLEDRFKIFGSTYLQFNLTDDLSFRTVLAGDFQNTGRNRWQGLKAHRNGASNITLDVSEEDRIHLMNENFLTYSKEYGAHEITAVAGIAAEKWDYSFTSAQAKGYENDLIKTISAGSDKTASASGEEQERFLSQFGRLTYAYDLKYLASLSVRRDGSSIFGPDKKYGIFPAISAGWVVSQESFLANNNMINFLKFRVSYGLTGNNDLDNLYPSIALLGPNTAVFDGSLAGGIEAINIANRELGWESSREINPGVDFELFGSFLSGSVDYYNRTSDELLLDNPISTTTGFSNALVNLGKVENKGFEVELRTNNVRTRDFSWTTSLIASRNENTLLDFADSDGQIQSVDSKRAAEWINLEGNPISSFYGWVVDEEIDPKYLKEPFHPVGGQAQDVYVKDLNGDGLIDDDDKAIIGDPYPDLVWSLGNEISFRGIDLSFMIQGTHGAEVRNMGDQYLFNQFNSGQDFTSDAPNQQFIKQKIFTNSIVQDASYLSLRNVIIGFDLGRLIPRASDAFSRARVYFSGQNLIYNTAEGYTGYNPESINDTSPTTYGYQRAGSPIARTISVGLNLEF